MIRHLPLAETLDLLRSVIERWGGASGIPDLGPLESALSQPRQSVGGQGLYPDLYTWRILARIIMTSAEEETQEAQACPSLLAE